MGAQPQNNLGMGCSALGSRCNRRESLRALNRAFDSGITFFDTADFYGQGDSEKILGDVFYKKRSQVTIATKAGLSYKKTFSYLKPLKSLVRPLVNKSPLAKSVATQITSNQITNNNFSSAYLNKAICQSLKRLRTDYIDSFLLHNPTIDILEQGDVFNTLSKLKASGKCKQYGLSCANVDEAIFALSLPNTGLSTLQFELNIIHQESLKSLLPICFKNNILTIARAPFAGGILLKNPPPKLIELSNEWSIPISQIAIKFALQQKGVSVVISSMVGPGHLKEGINATNSKQLTPDQISSLQKIGV
ncbi:MAG: aryl-alcohol dehydrogenase-like predicted oxidoreductase [Candidatus Omnitrophota bacterium]|jgi:aryl-alcohol dehydrogenase-like predicted oxidoreductase